VTTNEEIHEALLMVRSQLDTIDGKVNLIARADRQPLLDALREVVLARPIIGRIYLLLDGTRNQEAITAELKANGVATSKSAVSRWLVEMQGEHGMVGRVPNSGNGNLYRKSGEFEHILNLTRKVEQWLEEVDKPKTPAAAKGK
jgi:hypothetical protein